MYTDRIGINHKSSAAPTQRDETEMLLAPAEQQSQQDTCNSSENRNKASFEQKDTDNETVIGSQIA